MTSTEMAEQVRLSRSALWALALQPPRRRQPHALGVYQTPVGYTPLMLMVIFGAGASYDSSPEFPPPPPQAARQNFGSPPSPTSGRLLANPGAPL